MSTRELLRSRLREAAARLKGIEAGNPPLEAEHLLAHAIGVERIDLLRRGEDDPVPPTALERFDRLLARRLDREPLQYVLGTMPFCEIELAVGPGVLIPRGETEVLVERVSAAIREMERAGLRSAEVNPKGRPREEMPLLVDAGTGSGAILLALLHRFEEWIGLGTDASDAALVWAKDNRARLRIERAMLVQCDLLAAVRPGSARVIVSNPPYIPTAEVPDLAPEIREYEPLLALDGGADGFAVFGRLLDAAVAVLAPGGLFAVELAPGQPAEAVRRIEATGVFDRTEIFQDLAGRSRGVLAWRKVGVWE